MYKTKVKLNEQSPKEWQYNSGLVIVAHPDDETLWAGGTVLMHPGTKWTIVTLCRKNDPDRAPKFFRAVKEFGAMGVMGDVNDGSEQKPLRSHEVQNAIIRLLPTDRYDLIITHGIWGEYTRHLRHKETGQAVVALWEAEELSSTEIWRFAYEDGGKRYLPQAISNADVVKVLPDEIWKKKYVIMTEIYGFDGDSFEARTTPRTEAFWRHSCESEYSKILDGE